jgi:hypothetical protein
MPSRSARAPRRPSEWRPNANFTRCG